MTAENTTTITLRYPRCATKAKEDAPLSLQELHAIWRCLPDNRKLSFIIALDEDIADQLISYSYWAKQHQNGA